MSKCSECGQEQPGPIADLLAYCAKRRSEKDFYGHEDRADAWARRHDALRALIAERDKPVRAMPGAEFMIRCRAPCHCDRCAHIYVVRDG